MKFYIAKDEKEILEVTQERRPDSCYRSEMNGSKSLTSHIGDNYFANYKCIKSTYTLNLYNIICQLYLN